MQKVIVSGGFDPLHTGHISLFKDASKHGEVIVALNSDSWLERKKGKAFMPFAERKAVIEELKCVSEVIEFDDTDGTAIKAIESVFVNNPLNKVAFANGGDRTLDNIPEYEICNRLGVEILVGIGGNDKMQSSSALLSNWKHNSTSRPWGNYNSLHNGGKVRVKQLVIDSYESISLQYHHHREEHWFIESGIALVKKGNRKIELGPGEYIKIDKMELHRITNVTVPQEPLKLIEVQVGDILDEQDIVRTEEKKS